MGIEIPGYLQWVSYLAGEKWPEGDETAMRRIADAWNSHAGQLRDIIPDLDSVTREVQEVLVGESAKAIEEQFSKMFSGDYAVDKLADGMEGLGELADSTGLQIEYTKYNIIASLAIAAVEIAWAIASAAATWGGSLSLIPITQMATRLATAAAQRVLRQVIMRQLAAAVTRTTIRKLVGKAIGEIAKEALQETLIGLAQEAAVQGLQVAQGNRDGFDTKQLGDTAWQSGLGGALGGATNLGFRGATDRMFGPATTGWGGAFRGGAGGYLSGLVGNGGTMLVTGGEFNAAGFFGGAATSGMTGAIHGSTAGAPPPTRAGGTNANGANSPNGTGQNGSSNTGDGTGNNGSNANSPGSSENGGNQVNSQSAPPGSESSGSSETGAGSDTSGDSGADADSSATSSDAGTGADSETSGRQSDSGTEQGQSSDAGQTSTPQSAGVSDGDGSGSQSNHQGTPNAQTNTSTAPGDGGGQGAQSTNGAAANSGTPSAAGTSEPGSAAQTPQHSVAPSQGDTGSSTSQAGAGAPASAGAPSGGAPAAASAAPASAAPATTAAPAPAAGTPTATPTSGSPGGPPSGPPGGPGPGPSNPVSPAAAASAPGASPAAGSPNTNPAAGAQMRPVAMSAIADHPAASGPGASARPAGAGVPTAMHASTAAPRVDAPSAEAPRSTAPVTSTGEAGRPAADAGDSPKVPADNGTPRHAATDDGPSRRGDGPEEASTRQHDDEQAFNPDRVPRDSGDAPRREDGTRTHDRPHADDDAALRDPSNTEGTVDAELRGKPDVDQDPSDATSGRPRADDPADQSGSDSNRSIRPDDDAGATVPDRPDAERDAALPGRPNADQDSVIRNRETVGQDSAESHHASGPDPLTQQTQADNQAGRTEDDGSSRPGDSVDDGIGTAAFIFMLGITPVPVNIAVSASPMAASRADVFPLSAHRGDLVAKAEAPETSQPGEDAEGGRHRKQEAAPTDDPARTEVDELARQEKTVNAKDVEESRRARSEAPLSAVEESTKVAKRITDAAQQIAESVGQDPAPPSYIAHSLLSAPDVVGTTTIMGALLGALTVKQTVSGVRYVTSKVQGWFGGSGSDTTAGADNSHTRGAAPGQDLADYIDASNSNRTVTAPIELTQSRLDDVVGQLNSTNESGQQCGDQAVATRDLLNTGRTTVPESRGPNYPGMSVNELAGMLDAPEGFSRTDHRLIAETLSQLGDQATATVVGRNADGTLHAVTVASVEGTLVVIDPSAQPGNRVTELRAGLQRFTETGATFHDGLRTVPPSDPRVEHSSDSGSRRPFGDHARVGTRDGDPGPRRQPDGDDGDGPRRPTGADDTRKSPADNRTTPNDDSSTDKGDEPSARHRAPEPDAISEPVRTDDSPQQPNPEPTHRPSARTDESSDTTPLTVLGPNDIPIQISFTAETSGWNSNPTAIPDSLMSDGSAPARTDADEVRSASHSTEDTGGRHRLPDEALPDRRRADFLNDDGVQGQKLDDAANEKMRRERNEAPARMAQTVTKSIKKAIESTQKNVESVGHQPAPVNNVGHAITGSPDAVAMLAISGAVLGTAAVKSAIAGFKALAAQVRGWFGGSSTSSLSTATDSDQSRPRGGDPDQASGDPVLSPAADREARGLTRAELDDLAGQIDSTNESGQQCAEQAAAMRELLNTGRTEVPPSRGPDYSGMSVNELAALLGAPEGFTPADIQSISQTLSQLGDRATATVVGRNPDGSLHAVTVARVEGELVVIDPSAHPGDHVTGMQSGLQGFTDLGVTFHDGRQTVSPSDPRVSHPSDSNGRKVFGDHEKVGTRQEDAPDKSSDGEVSRNRQPTDESDQNAREETRRPRRSTEDAQAERPNQSTDGQQRRAADDATVNRTDSGDSAARRSDGDQDVADGRRADRTTDRTQGREDDHTSTRTDDTSQNRNRTDQTDESADHNDSDISRDAQDETNTEGYRDRSVDRDPIPGVERSGLTREQKAADPRYRNKYYYHRSSEGRWVRVNANAVDADGDPVPKLDAEGNIMSDDVVPARFGKYDQAVSAALSHAARKLIALREKARSLRVKLESSPLGKRTVHRILTNVGERLGEESIRPAMENRYPSDQYSVQRLQREGTRGQGVFDAVFRVIPLDGTPSFIVLIEAKGPSASLGDRRGTGNNSSLRFQQGRREYVLSVIASMRGSGEPAQKLLAAEIATALYSGTLSYQLVQARLDGAGNYTGFRHRDFEIDEVESDGD